MKPILSRRACLDLANTTFSLHVLTKAVAQDLERGTHLGGAQQGYHCFQVTEQTPSLLLWQLRPYSGLVDL
jgi:hypothetical protein